MDYAAGGGRRGEASYGPEGLRVAQMDALALGFAAGRLRRWCSSHLIEHFTDPEPHVAELARVL